MGKCRRERSRDWRLVLIGCLVVTGGGCAGSDGSTRQAPRVPGDAVAGESTFVTACARCHGFSGEGLPGLGKPLRDNRSVREKSEGQLVQFLEIGRPADDPLNSTGVEMPPRGGIPELTDQDLRNVAAFLHRISP